MTSAIGSGLTLVSANNFKDPIPMPGVSSGVGQLTGSIVPVDLRDLTFALLVGISLSIVVVKREITICPGENLHMRDALLIVSTFDHAAQWHDGTRLHKQRNRIDGGVHPYGLPTLNPFSRPVLLPARSTRQLDALRGLPLRLHR